MSFLNILYKVYSFCIALPIFVLITIFVSTSVIIAGFLGDTDITCLNFGRSVLSGSFCFV